MSSIAGLPPHSPAPQCDVIPAKERRKLTISYADIAALAFTGRDTAAGKSFEAWMKKYREKKAAGEKGIGIEAESSTKLSRTPLISRLKAGRFHQRMNVFLTGATGFVGSHVARAFAAQGARLHLLVRSTSRLDNLEGLSAETVIGDLRDPDSFRSALSDCEVLVHVAADYRLVGARSPGHVRGECRRHAQPAGAGPRGWSEAGCLHVERGDDGLSQGWHHRG